MKIQARYPLLVVVLLLCAYVQCHAFITKDRNLDSSSASLHAEFPIVFASRNRDDLFFISWYTAPKEREQLRELLNENKEEEEDKLTSLRKCVNTYWFAVLPCQFDEAFHDKIGDPSSFNSYNTYSPPQKYLVFKVFRI